MLLEESCYLKVTNSSPWNCLIFKSQYNYCFSFLRNIIISYVQNYHKFQSILIYWRTSLSFVENEFNIKLTPYIRSYLELTTKNLHRKLCLCIPFISLIFEFPCYFFQKQDKGVGLLKIIYTQCLLAMYIKIMLPELTTSLHLLAAAQWQKLKGG